MTAEQLKQLETRLWKTADDLRANSKLTASEYSFPVLGLIFLRQAYTKLPFPTFSDGDRVVKTEILFDYFKTRYANFGRVA